MPAVKQFALTKIRLLSKHRPDGYYEDVVSRGKIVGEHLELSRAAFDELVAKYREKPVDENDWPLWARAFRFFHELDDIGIGDTIARIIGPSRSKAFKAFYRRTFGKNCGCANRQAKLNRLYPYQSPTRSSSRST